MRHHERAAALEFAGVSLQYSEGLFALREATFTLCRGEWVAIMGANGSGKSTLTRLAAGVLVPHAGEVRAFGCATAAPGFAALRPRIGYLSQHPEDHVIGLTVGEDVAFGLVRLGWPEEAVARRVRACLAAVGMAGAEGRPPHRLSGGELQRVALAGVLAPRPELLVLDEPTAYADPDTRRLVLRVVSTYARASGAAVLWVTHDTEEASSADRVLVLHGGRLAFDGPPGALWGRREDLERWGIGPVPGEGTAERIACRTGGLRAPGVAPAPGPKAVVAAAHRVSFTYPGAHRPTLCGAGVSVDAGACVALIGPSGAGKSTLLQVLALLALPQAGELSVLGERVPTGTGRRTRRRWRAAARQLQPRIGLTLQQAEVQLFGRTLRDDFVFALRHLGVPQAVWEARIRDALDRTGLPAAYLDRRPTTLSGGERRRAAIAVCLAQRPALYLFDEPTAGLDYPGRVQIAQAIAALAREQGAGVLLASHDTELVTHCADAVVLMRDGKTASTDEPLEEGAGQGDGPGPGVSADLDDGGDTAPGSKPTGQRGTRPEAHLLGAALLALAVASVRSWTGLAAGGMLVVVLLLGVRAPLRSLLPLAAGLTPFAAAAALFGGPAPASDVGFGAKAAAGAFAGLRMLFAVASVGWLGRALTLPQMFSGLQRLLRPLRRVGLPAEVLTASTLVAIAMVRVLSEEARRIDLTQRMRGLAGRRGLRGAWARVRSLALPLFGSALRRAEHLSVAVLMRGYGEGMPLRSRRLRPREWAPLGAFALAALLVVICDRLGG